MPNMAGQTCVCVHMLQFPSLPYINLYKGLRSFVLVPWMQHQCPVKWLIKQLQQTRLLPDDGWMTCDFRSFSTVFQSSSGDQTRSARSVSQRLAHWATGATTSTKMLMQIQGARRNNRCGFHSKEIHPTKVWIQPGVTDFGDPPQSSIVQQNTKIQLQWLGNLMMKRIRILMKNGIKLKTLPGKQLLLFSFFFFGIFPNKCHLLNERICFSWSKFIPLELIPF